VPSFRRRASVIDADRVDEPKQEPDRAADAAEALALAEEAEAEAAEAEAIAAAARARTRAIRLRRQAQAAGGDASSAKAKTPVDPAADVIDAAPESADSVELTEPSTHQTAWTRTSQLRSRI
jgi:Mce-associated membrane protein